ncbi:MAG: four-carbon acid sugar kinase family protein [Clostridium sp.]
MSRYLIIADDFTGANDSGVQLKRRGIETDVLFSTELMTSNSNSYVIDTESRGMKGEEAYKCVYDTAYNINLEEFKYVIKKVDSTLRGNIPEEIKGLDDVFKSELIIFTPALPDLNRTTVNGVHKLNNIPITETELARDPKKPVTEDNLSKILEKVFLEEITHVCIDDIEKEEFDFSKGRIFSFDSVTNRHMQRVIRKAIATDKKIMWVGTAAIVENLMEVERKTTPSMAMVGSVSSVTRGQVKYAEEKGLTLLKIPIKFNFIRTSDCI